MEFELIDRIGAHMDVKRDDIALGMGDDVALLRVPADHQLAVSVDTLVEGVHFFPGTPAADVGWKALAVNLSDLAAMGATPAWAVVALTLPDADAGFVDGFVDGFMRLARQHDLALVGGDTTQGPLSVTVTIHGIVPAGQALVRHGAQAGDVIFVTGTLGDAAAALACMDEPGEAASSLRERLLHPVPRVAAGKALRGVAHAAIDISDGLLADLGHICRRSGVGARVDADQVPRSVALNALFGATRARDFALVGGDAYELCFTAPAEAADDVVARVAGVGGLATAIGRIVPGSGVTAVDGSGRALMPAEHPWEHFSS